MSESQAHPSAEPTDLLGRAVEAALYAPVGLFAAARELAPSVLTELVARGRAEVDRIDDEVRRRYTTVRSTGEVAIAFGLPMARERAKKAAGELGDRLGAVLRTGRPTPERTPRPAAVADAAQAPAPNGAAASGNGANGATRTTAATAVAPAAAPTAASREAAALLAIPGYDSLSASQVCERLVGLSSGELAAVRTYERAHRNRRTILGKLDQLADVEP